MYTRPQVIMKRHPPSQVLLLLKGFCFVGQDVSVVLAAKLFQPKTKAMSQMFCDPGDDLGEQRFQVTAAEFRHLGARDAALLSVLHQQEAELRRRLTQTAPGAGRAASAGPVSLTAPQSSCSRGLGASSCEAVRVSPSA